MQALASFDYEPAYSTWLKLIKSKSKGEKIFIGSNSDSISDIIANEFLIFLVQLIEQKKGYILSESQLSNFKTFISIMLGKGSEKMQEVYRFVAQNSDKLSTFNFNLNSKDLFINDYLHFYNPTADDIKRIFPAILSMSILKGMDNRLIQLANELNEKYSENWLSPVFLSNLLMQPAHAVFDDFSDNLHDTEKSKYLYDTFGALFFDKEIKQHAGLLFWGQYKYGEIDSRFAFSRPLCENLDERWYLLFTQNNQGKVTLQAYNRSGVFYESFDELFVEILPVKINDPYIEKILKDYFIQKEKLHNGFSTLYIEALNILDCEIGVDVIKRFIECKDNAVDKYYLKSIINQFSNWSNQKKLEFYQTLPSRFILSEEIENLEKQ
ncbi:hypothetical protein [Acinetobacter populi]|uniref:Uncharacterized protein n=1 Tax=Acinetobacter populi TaxID=1582270 RepID=A0A1Z9Z0U4_9GAMM|nr:hypothetical protein [Acinetobacter populi]OUY08121.1 hypothetical protein CAP51_00410 [Acinetobacter populi]